MDRAGVDAAIVNHLCEFLLAGWSVEQACPYVGLDVETGTRWLDQARKARQGIGRADDPELAIALSVEAAYRVGHGTAQAVRTTTAIDEPE